MAIPCLVNPEHGPGDRLGRCTSCYGRLRRRDVQYLAAEQNRRYIRRYGITADEVRDLKVAANYRCQICGALEESFEDGLAVDHDHFTGHPRGVLCPTGCNPGIGFFSDDPIVLAAAVDYLTRILETIPKAA